MKIELNRYRNFVATNGYNSTFNPSNRTLVISRAGVIEQTYKCDYSCGTWYITIEDVK